jgi:hypothetical protein
MIDDSENDARHLPPRRLLSLVFWLALLGGLVCIVGGSVVALYGPRLFPVHLKAPLEPRGAPPEHRAA